MPESAQRAALGEFETKMRTRRSVREFSPEPVPLELIEQAIAIAGTAPSGANQQPWRFVVVSDPAVKREIRMAAEAEERENYERRFPPEWLEALAPFGTDWHKEFLEVAPCLIVVFRIDYGLSADGRKQKHYYVNESVGIATGFPAGRLADGRVGDVDPHSESDGVPGRDLPPARQRASVSPHSRWLSLGGGRCPRYLQEDTGGDLRGDRNLPRNVVPMIWYEGLMGTFSP